MMIRNRYTDDFPDHRYSLILDIVGIGARTTEDKHDHHVSEYLVYKYREKYNHNAGQGTILKMT